MHFIFGYCHETMICSHLPKIIKKFARVDKFAYLKELLIAINLLRKFF